MDASPRRPLRLPELGLGTTPIRLSLWLAKLGDRVEHGDPLAEVTAGAAVVDLPSPGDGVLVEKSVAEDELLAVGQTLGWIEQRW